MLVGYMRVSSESDRQITDLQREALLAAVRSTAGTLFEDHASGAKDDRLGLNQALTFVRPGDVLVVWKLIRLGRSLSHLLCIVNTLKEKQVSVAVIEMAAGVTTACFTPCSRAPSAQVTLFFFWRVSAAASRTAPIAFSSIQKSEYVHMQYYRVRRIYGNAHRQTGAFSSMCVFEYSQLYIDE